MNLLSPYSEKARRLVAFLGTGDAWYAALRALAIELRARLDGGQVTELDLIAEAESLVSAFTRGEYFEQEIELALIAIALERRHSALAEQFIRQLADLHIAEIPMAPFVAKRVLSERRDLPGLRLIAFPSHSSSNVLAPRPNLALAQSRGNADTRPTGHPDAVSNDASSVGLAC